MNPLIIHKTEKQKHQAMVDRRINYFLSYVKSLQSSIDKKNVSDKEQEFMKLLNKIEQQVENIKTIP